MEKSGTIHCPTCRAKQEPAPVCRRCGSDLELLLRVLADYEANRRECIARFREGNFAAAMQLARRCHLLHPDDALTTDQSASHRR